MLTDQERSLLEQKRIEVGTLPTEIFFPEDSLDRLDVTEGKHFWHRTKARMVWKCISKWTKSESSSVMDVGCGSGGILEVLERRNSESRLCGVEGYVSGLFAARERSQTTRLVLHDITQTLDHDALYDAIVFADVLEHIDDPVSTLRHFAEFLTDDGIAVINMPAHMWLWSTRDEYQGHRLRYDRHTLSKLVEDAGLSMIHINGLYSFILPPVWFFRRMIAKFKKTSGENIESKEKTVLPIVNWLLLQWGKFDLWLSLIGFPVVGTSVYCVARKRKDT